MKRKVFQVCLYLIITLALSGCGGIELFPEKETPYELKETDKEKLKKEEYYVKDGTKFYHCYMPDGTVQNMTNKPNPERIVWVGKDINLIPTLYKNESIAYCSESDSLEYVILERFENIGYSIGSYLSEYDMEKGLISLNTEHNLVSGTSMKSTLSNAKSKSIKIETINNQPVEQNMLNDSGIFTCFEENLSYTLGYYAGTYYTESTVIADTQYLISYEIFQTDQIEYTKNGYLSITMPDYLKSGYYYINGSGFFRYVAEEKQNADIASIDFNTPTSSEDIYGVDISKYQTYSCDITQNETDMVFNIELGENPTNEEVDIIIMSPAGAQYSAELESENTYTCYLGSVQAGKWHIIISPLTLEVESILLTNIPVTLSTQYEEFNVELQKGQSVTFNISYEIDIKNDNYNKFLCVVTAPDGTLYNFIADKRNKQFTCDIPYTQEGTYSIKIYYYSAYTSITNVSCEDNTGQQIEISRPDGMITFDELINSEKTLLPE